MKNSLGLTPEQFHVLNDCADDYEPFKIVLEMYCLDYGETPTEVVQGHLKHLIAEGLLDHYRIEDGDDLRLVKAAPESLGFRDYGDMFYASKSGIELIESWDDGESTVS